MTDPYEIALDSLPGLRTIQTANETVQKRLAALRSVTVAPDTVDGEVFAALTAGQPLPDDVGRRAWEAQQDEAHRETEIKLLMRMETRLGHQLQNVLRTGVDDAVHALRPVLDELIEHAQPLIKELRDVHNAQTAIDRGVVPAWSEFKEIVTRYAAIREAQLKICRYAVADTSVFVKSFPVWSEIENVTEVWPQWHPSIDPAKSPAPWPVVHKSMPFDQVRYDRQWVMWLLTHPTARIWIPTVDELQDAQERQQKSAAKRARERADSEPGRRTGERRRRPAHYEGRTGPAYEDIDT